jgi:hypothetical protein
MKIVRENYIYLLYRAVLKKKVSTIKIKKWRLNYKPPYSFL